MKRKLKVSVIFLLFFALFLFTATLVFAYSYHDEANRFLDRVCRPRASSIIAVLCSFRNRLDNLEEETDSINARVDTLEETSLPEGKWVHVCFNVATANLSVMKGGTCFPHVHWKIFVQCYDDKPCVPDNPEDSYFDPPQEQ